MRPQDIVVLLKILCYGSKNWYSKDLSADLFLSSAEVSNSLQRSAISGLLDTDKKKVRAQSLFEFLVFGAPFVFSERPGFISRGIPTAHSHPFMMNHFSSDQLYVWPDAEGEQKGLSVQPLYPAVVKAVKKDDILYLMLALIDVLRVGKVREKQVAIAELRKMIVQ